MAPVHAALTVNLNPGNYVSPEAQLSLTFSQIPFPGNLVTNYTFDMDQPNSYVGTFSGTSFFRSTDSPPVGSEIDSLSAGYYQTQEAGTNTYQGGAIAGTDNWIYITSLSDGVAWAQVEINGSAVTPIKYVYDTVDRTAPIALADAVAVVPEPSTFALLAGISVLSCILYRRKR